jgi:peroxiredoxin
MMNIVYSKNTPWFKAVLYIAGAYHILWGFSVIFFPFFWFDLAALAHPNYTQLWQFIGLYEVVFGVGYLMAASNPLRHWRVVLMGFVTKLAVVIGFTYFYYRGEEPFVIFNMVLSNHIFWLIPFLVILYNAYRHQYLLDNEMIHLNGLEVSELLDFYETNKGESLRDLSNRQPVMLVFLRHFGCTFCKETLWFIQKLRPDIEAKGTKIVLVHMHNEAKANDELKKYNLQYLDTVSDPESMLYKGFHLKRGTLTQVLGFKVWIRGIYLWITKGAFISSPDGVDTFQMPGIFLVHNGEIIKQYIHLSAADIPPYMELATCENCSALNVI